MWQTLSRPFFLALGCISLALGFVGIFLPLLPTTPFVLLAAFAFARSSKRLHQWILGHKHYGPLVLGWQKHGVIRPRIKWIATASIIFFVGASILLIDAPLFAELLLAIICGCVICFILTRPGEIRKKGD